MRSRLCLILCVVFFGPVEAAPVQAASPFTVQDLVSLRRLSDPQISPDGRHAAYVLRETDIEANKGRTDLWLIDFGAKGAQADAERSQRFQSPLGT